MPDYRWILALCICFASPGCQEDQQQSMHAQSAQATPVQGDSLDAVYQKWGQPEAVKLNGGGHTYVLRFSEMPNTDKNPYVELSLYYLAKSRTVRLTRGDARHRTVAAVQRISAADQKAAEQAVNRVPSP